MDPNACLEQILQDLIDIQNADPALSKEDLDESRDNFVNGLRNLAHWVSSGGFVPTLKVRIQK